MSQEEKNDGPAETLEDLKQAHKKLNELVHKEIKPLVSKLVKIREEQRYLKEKQDYLKEEASQVSAEIEYFMKQYGLEENPLYMDGLRMSFDEVPTAKVKAGCEEEFARWADETGNNHLCAIKVPTNALKQHLNSGLTLPDSVEQETLKKFKVLSDRRKG